MTDTKQKRLAYREAAEFNEQYPVGTQVRFWPEARVGEGKVGRTFARAAQSLGTAVVWITEDSAVVKTHHCIALSHVDPLVESEL